MALIVWKVPEGTHSAGAGGTAIVSSASHPDRGRQVSAAATG